MQGGRFQNPSTKEDGAALTPRGVQRTLYRRKGSLIDEESHQRPGVQRIANALGSNTAIRRVQAFQEFVRDTHVGNDADPQL